MQVTKAHHLRRFCALGLTLVLATLAPSAMAQTTAGAPISQVADLLAQGDQAFQIRDYESALRHYATAAQVDPDSPLVVERLQEAQRREAARQRLLLTVPAEPQAREQFLERRHQQALALLHDNRLEAAAQRFEEIFFVDPDYRRVRRQLERLDAQLAAEGLASFTELPTVSPGGAAQPVLPEDETRIAQIERAESEAETAARRAAEAVQSERDRAAEVLSEATISQALRDGRRALRRDEYTEAIRHAETVLALDPANATAQRLIEDATAERDAHAMAERRAEQTAANEEQEQRIEDLLEQAEEYLEDERFAEAISTAEMVFEIEVDNAEAQRFIAQVNEAAQEAEREALERQAREREEQISDLLRSGRRSLRRDNFEEAQTAAEQALAMDPSNAEAAELLSQAQAGAAAVAQEAAARDLAEQVDALLDQARQCLRDDDYQAAIDAANSALALDAENERARALIADAQREMAVAADAAQERQLEGLLDQARRSLRADECEAAIATANQVLAIDAENDEARELIADAQREMAAAAAEQAAAQNAQRVAELIDSARAAMDAGENEAALEMLREAESLDPGNRGISRMIRRAESAIADAQREAQEAEQVQRQETEEADQARAEALEDALRLADRALRRERYEEAIEHYQAALAVAPDDAAAAEGLANAEQALAAIQAAEATTQEAEAQIAAGEAALREGDLDAAEAAFQMAGALVPGLEAAQEGLGQVAQAREEAMERAQLEAMREAREREDQMRAQSEQRLAEAQSLLQAGRLNEAEGAVRESLALWPENTRAQSTLGQIDRMREQAAQAEVDREARNREALVSGLLAEGRQAYDQGDVVAAVESWTRVVEIDPNNDYALTLLENTEAEHRGALALERAEADQMAREQEMLERLSTPISITTPSEGTPLQVFLENISIFTDLNFVIADGVEVQVTGAFVEQPLRRVLDSVITNNGLSWTVEDTIISITPNLVTRMWTLTSEDTASLVVFRDSGMLDRTLYPPDGVSRVGGEMYELDDITGTFIVTGSQAQIQRIEQLVADLSTVEGARPLVTRIFRVREDEGEHIRTLVEAVLETERSADTQAFERRIILQGENLIVRATDPELRRVEQLLEEYSDRGLGEQLDVATFSLIPRRVLQVNEEVARTLAESIKETVEVLLYAEGGAQAARAQGRRLWYDEFTLQLTITDTPSNIGRVTRYITSIPVLEPRRTTRIVYLNHQTPSELAGKLEDFLDIEIRGGGGGSSTSATGDVVVRTLSEDDELSFRDIRITLISVEENDIDDDRDEDVTMIIDTLNSSEERTIEELRSEIIEDYRIRIVEADADGSGSAEIEVTYVGNQQNQNFQIDPLEGSNQQQQQEGDTTDQTTGTEDDRIPIVQADDEAGSILISVVNPGDLALIEEAIQLLDVPILQASIETKFVEVNENRARELKSEISLAGIGREGINFSDSFFSARYAQDTDEFRNIFEPALESPTNANLPKGTTVLSLITGGRSPLTWELAFLEAEGVINTVNGPFVTAVNRERAQFEITQQYNVFGSIAGVSTTSGTDSQNQTTTGTAGVGANLLDRELVDLDVEPIIFRSGYMELEINVDISNFTNNLGQLITTTGAIQTADQGGGLGLSEDAVRNIFGVYSNNLKQLDTVARVRDGGTIILGGWTLERVTQTSSGIPVLRNLPYVGQLFFSRNQDFLERLTLLIFLTARIVEFE
ncbi:hypothetical protein JXA47_05985 [Candidatus Sumerlaeota bacterium]|nr:hypothetical protein [Candidatus Sumerlaeota bacterium]